LVKFGYILGLARYLKGNIIGVQASDSAVEAAVFYLFLGKSNLNLEQISAAI